MASEERGRILDSLDCAYSVVVDGEEYEGVQRKPADLSLEARFLAQQALARTAAAEGEAMVRTNYEQYGHMGE